MCAHISVWKTEVSYAHTVKATLPVFTVALSRLITGATYSAGVYVSLVPIVGGVALASATEVSFDALGLAMAIAATAGFSVVTILTKKAAVDTGIHTMALLHLLGFVSFAFVVPAWLEFDLTDILNMEVSSKHYIIVVCPYPIEA